MQRQGQDDAKAQIIDQFQARQKAATQSDAKQQRLREMEQAEQTRLSSRAAALEQNHNKESHFLATSSPDDIDEIDRTLADLFLDDDEVVSSIQLTPAGPVDRTESLLASPSAHRSVAIARAARKTTISVTPSKTRSTVRPSVAAGKNQRSGKR